MLGHDAHVGDHGRASATIAATRAILRSREPMEATLPRAGEVVSPRRRSWCETSCIGPIRLYRDTRRETPFHT